MNQDIKKLVICIDDYNHINWKKCLESQLSKLESATIEIDCKNLNLSCSDINEIVDISNQFNCNVISFCSTSTKTIVSAQSLGYTSQFVLEKYSKNNLKANDQSLNSTKTHFHKATVRSGEYLESSEDLVIIGDVNPGAVVSAEGNIIIWGRLLGIAHAGNKGNTQARISALQLRPIQLRIANKVARGPQEKPQLGLAEQATINSEKIIISPIDNL